MRRCSAPFLLLLFISFFYSSAQDNKSESYSIIKSTEASDKHTTLLAAIRAAELDDLLGFDGPFTMFAPSDVALQELLDYTAIDFNDPKNKRKLQDIVSYHLVVGNLTASKILSAMCKGNGTASFTTVQGNKIIATMSGLDIVLTDSLGNTSKIIAADSTHCNGVIHEIDSVVLPSEM